MRAKIIKLCEGHRGGFGLMKIISPKAVYRGTPITKLKVVLADKEKCVQCLSNKRAKAKREASHGR